MFAQALERDFRHAKANMDTAQALLDAERVKVAKGLAGVAEKAKRRRAAAPSGPAGGSLSGVPTGLKM